MTRLLALLLAFLTLTASAEIVESQRHQFQLKLPEGSTWLRGRAEPLANAEMVLNMRNTSTQQSLMLLVVENFATPDIANPAAMSRVIELIQLLGFTVSAPVECDWDSHRAYELKGGKQLFDGGNLVAVGRATIRNGKLYIAWVFGPGAAERVQDARFRAPIDTFKFIQPSVPPNPQADPYFWHYIAAYKAIFGVIGGLVVLFVLVLIFARKPHYM